MLLNGCCLLFWCLMMMMPWATVAGNGSWKWQLPICNDGRIEDCQFVMPSAWLLCSCNRNAFGFWSLDHHARTERNEWSPNSDGQARLLFQIRTWLLGDDYPSYRPSGCTLVLAHSPHGSFKKKIIRRAAQSHLCCCLRQWQLTTAFVRTIILHDEAWLVVIDRVAQTR